MQIRLLKYWEELRSSYWFVPGVMAVGAILLSVATIALDGYFRAEVLRSLGFIWSGGPEGARGLLQAVAGSMITVAGVTFSITMVALSFASSHGAFHAGTLCDRGGRFRPVESNRAPLSFGDRHCRAAGSGTIASGRYS